MNKTDPEVIVAIFAFTAFWLMVVLVILVLGKHFPKLDQFKGQMLSMWKPALIISIIFTACQTLAGNSLINPYTMAIFCQAMLGLAIASYIPGFEPLPLSQAIHRRQKVAQEIGLLLGIALLAVLPALLIGTVGLNIGKQLFGEADYTSQAASSLLTTNKWLVFFSALGGAGIAEETTYRLVSLSLVWKLTHRKWLAIVISSMIFGAYHLTPLTGMYQIFWQFPISQFIASTLIGLVWGYVYTKRGFGTAVLGHAFSDWLPLMLFT